MCTRDQLRILASEWEIPLKPNDTKQIMIGEIQDTSLERGTYIDETDKKHDQVLAEIERLKQELEQVKREVAIKKGINIGWEIRMVPIFREEEPEEFFRHFEKLAVQMKWPERHWSTLVLGKLVGKARRTFNDLSIEESQEYTNIKEFILSAYGMVPKADRVKFRQLPLVNDILCKDTNMSNFSDNGSTVSVVTVRAVEQEGKLKDDNADGRLSGLDVSQTERIKTQKEDESLAAVRTKVQNKSEKAQ